MTTTARRALLEQAATQYGVFTRQQAQAGLTDRQLTALARSGVAVPLDRVWRTSGTPASDEALAMAAVLRKGRHALLARSSAAWVWRAWPSAGAGRCAAPP